MWYSLYCQLPGKNGQGKAKCSFKTIILSSNIFDFKIIPTAPFIKERNNLNPSFHYLMSTQKQPISGWSFQRSAISNQSTPCF
jgi:hypothetical protein